MSGRPARPERPTAGVRTGDPPSRSADPRETIRRALAERPPRRSTAGEEPEPERRAAVALVLRPPRSRADGREAASAPAGGEAARTGPGGERPAAPWPPRRVVADGVVGRARPPDRRPAPLFPGRLAGPLRRAEALFVVRAEREGDPWSGQVGLPGGHAEPVDPDLRAAALRELEEEAGLALARSDVLGRLEEIRPRSRRLPSVAVTPFVAWHGGGTAVRAGREVAGHFWTPLAALESPGRRIVLTFRRDGALRAFPGIGHPEGIVWGLTFALLRRFLRLLPRADGETALDAETAGHGRDGRTPGGEGTDRHERRGRDEAGGGEGRSAAREHDGPGS